MVFAAAWGVVSLARTVQEAVVTFHKEYLAKQQVAHSTLSVHPERTALLTGQALLDALKQGGLVLYLRHLNTDHRKWHEDPIKERHHLMKAEDFLRTCEQQRALTDYGRMRGRDIGEALRKLGIPLGKVVSSPYCRVMESARLVAGREPDEAPYALVYRGGGLTQEQMVRNLLPYLGTVPEAGTNTLLVSHRTQMDEVAFLDEGQMFVFRPLGGTRFELIGSIKASDWNEAATLDVAYLGRRAVEAEGRDSPQVTH